MSENTWTETSPRPGAWSIVTLVVAAACVVAAYWAWAQASPALGERPFSGARIGAARWAAVALWASGHTLLFGAAVPMIYRRRPFYVGLTAIFGLITALSAITAAALFAASAAATASGR